MWKRKVEKELKSLRRRGGWTSEGQVEIVLQVEKKV